MNIKEIKKIRNPDDYEAALVDLVNDYHDREGTPADERPDVRAELRKAVETLRGGDAPPRPASDAPRSPGPLE